jgi:transcriptional regulator with XRE-family HTH domain
MQRNVRQSDLAEQMSYEQSYISALEIGTKGPPTSEFLERLAAVLSLSEDERKRLDLAVEASKRKVVLDADKPQEIFWMFKELRDQLDFLTSSQVRAIREVLRITADANQTLHEPARRLRRRNKQEVKM